MERERERERRVMRFYFPDLERGSDTWNRGREGGREGERGERGNGEGINGWGRSEAEGRAGERSGKEGPRFWTFKYRFSDTVPWPSARATGQVVYPCLSLALFFHLSPLCPAISLLISTSPFWVLSLSLIKK